MVNQLAVGYKIQTKRVKLLKFSRVLDNWRPLAYLINIISLSSWINDSLLNGFGLFGYLPFDQFQNTKFRSDTTHAIGTKHVSLAYVLCPQLYSCLGFPFFFFFFNQMTIFSYTLYSNKATNSHHISNFYLFHFEIRKKLIRDLVSSRP